VATAISDPISLRTKWEAMPGEESDGRIVPDKRGESRVIRCGGQPSGLGKATGKGSWRKVETQMSKDAKEDKFHE
jgi:hypothetical protein